MSKSIISVFSSISFYFVHSANIVMLFRRTKLTIAVTMLSIVKVYNKVVRPVLIIETRLGAKKSTYITLTTFKYFKIYIQFDL